MRAETRDKLLFVQPTHSLDNLELSAPFKCLVQIAYPSSLERVMLTMKGCDLCAKHCVNKYNLKL